MTSFKPKLDRVRSLLGEPLLLAGEDRAAYDELLAAVKADRRPRTNLDERSSGKTVGGVASTAL